MERADSAGDVDTAEHVHHRGDVPDEMVAAQLIFDFEDHVIPAGAHELLTNSGMALSPRPPASRPYGRSAPGGREGAPTMRRARTQSPARARDQSTPTRTA